MNNKIINNKKIMIVKNKEQYHIINKTEKVQILTDNQDNYIVIRPHDRYTTKNEEVRHYVSLGNNNK